MAEVEEQEAEQTENDLTPSSCTNSTSTQDMMRMLYTTTHHGVRTSAASKKDSATLSSSVDPREPSLRGRVFRSYQRDPDSAATRALLQLAGGAERGGSAGGENRIGSLL